MFSICSFSLSDIYLVTTILGIYKYISFVLQRLSHDCSRYSCSRFGSSHNKEELVKVAELKRLEQGKRTMEEFVQEFKRAARESRYKGRLLIEEFKRGMNGVIRRKLMEAERPSTSIEQ